MRGLMAAALLLGGCAATGGGAQLTGYEWRATDINGAPVAGGPLTMRFDGGGRIAGNSGCNSYSGSYRFIPRERIEVGALAVTEMACEPAVMAQESSFLAILRAAESYVPYGDGSVSLITADGRAIRFRRSLR